MLNKKQAQVIFNATKQNPSMFDTFYQILSDAYSSSSKLEELVGQILNIINSTKPLLFHVKSGSLYEYKPLKESKEALKCVYDITKQVESLINTKYLLPLASNSDRSIKELSYKLTKDDDFKLKTKVRDSAQKMFDFQNDLFKKEENKNSIKNKLKSEFNKKLIEATSNFIKNKAAPALDKQTVEFKKKLDKWKKNQLKILEDKLTRMVPSHGYYFAYGGNKVKKNSSQIGKQQAKELAKEIVELVYKKRLNIFKKFKKQPTGGDEGNKNKVWRKIEGEMECADWAEIFYHGLQDNIREYYKKNLNSFRVEWRRNPPVFMEHGEHNYIIVIGPLIEPYLVLDPWESGGKKIIPKAEKSSNALFIKNYLYGADGKSFAYPTKTKQ